LSLGATKRGPPRTWRGTIVTAAAAEAAVVMKRRRLVSDLDVGGMAFLAGVTPGGVEEEW
jgi:hypothetical protein